MEKTVETRAGLSLIMGSLLIIVTMGLHPAGGSFAHLLEMTSIIVISHSIALFAMPFCWVGFWGLTRRLSASNFLSMLAFAGVSMGLVAGMCAAAVNGLVLPLFITRYETASSLPASVKPILTLIAALNHAFDFIFMAAVCLAVFSWSVVIVRTKALPVWIGWLGLLLPLLPGGLLLFGYDLVHLAGFRLFTLGLAAWILCVGYWLQKPIQFLGTNVSVPS